MVLVLSENAENPKIDAVMRRTLNVLGDAEFGNAVGICRNVQTEIGFGHQWRVIAGCIFGTRADVDQPPEVGGATFEVIVNLQVGFRRLDVDGAVDDYVGALFPQIAFSRVLIKQIQLGTLWRKNLIGAGGEIIHQVSADEAVGAENQNFHECDALASNGRIFFSRFSLCGSRSSSTQTTGAVQFLQKLMSQRLPSSMATCRARSCWPFQISLTDCCSTLPITTLRGQSSVQGLTVPSQKSTRLNSSHITISYAV